MYATVLAIALNALGGLFSAPQSPKFCPEHSKIDHKEAVLALFEEEEEKRNTKSPTLRARL